MTLALYLRPEPMKATELDVQVRAWLLEQDIDFTDDAAAADRCDRVILVPHGRATCYYNVSTSADHAALVARVVAAGKPADYVVIGYDEPIKPRFGDRHYGGSITLGIMTPTQQADVEKMIESYKILDGYDLWPARS